VVSGPREQARSYLEGLTVLANMRLCPNVPAQHAIAIALESPETIAALVLPGGRLLEQRNRTWELLNAIPGVSCVKPLGALYAFPRIDPDVLPIANDEQMALDLLRSERILIAHGSAFNIPTTDHFRLVTLPPVADLEDAITRIARFFETYAQ
jgi:alanine-synthesizing transaminase